MTVAVVEDDFQVFKLLRIHLEKVGAKTLNGLYELLVCCCCLLTCSTDAAVSSRAAPCGMLRPHRMLLLPPRMLLLAACCGLLTGLPSVTALSSDKKVFELKSEGGVYSAVPV